MTVTLQESRDKAGTTPVPEAKGGRAERQDRPEVLNFERSEVVHFFRELLDFLRDFSEARPRSRPTSPLSHRARNAGYRAAVRDSEEPRPYPPRLAAAGGQAGPVRAAVQGRAVAAQAGPEGRAPRPPEAVAAPAAPGTGAAGEIFRRPRSLAGSMPRPQEINAPAPVVELVEPEGPEVEVEPDERRDDILAPSGRSGRRRLRVPPFVSKL